MSGFADYDEYDATGLARLVAKREVTPLELVEAAIERVEGRDEKINAVIHRSFARARARAEAMGTELGGTAQRGEELPPFLGVPFLLKDLGAEDEGQPSTGSTKLRAGYRASADCELVHRFKSSGLIVIGRTNTPEFGWTLRTTSLAFGTTRHPLDADCSPGPGAINTFGMGESGPKGSTFKPFVTATRLPMWAAVNPPGPGDYELPPAIGEQVDSRYPTLPISSFARAPLGIGGLEQAAHLLSQSSLHSPAPGPDSPRGLNQMASVAVSLLNLSRPSAGAIAAANGLWFDAAPPPHGPAAPSEESLAAPSEELANGLRDSPNRLPEGEEEKQNTSVCDGQR